MKKLNKFIWIATCEDNSGGGYVEVFSSKKEANKWLEESLLYLYEGDYDPDNPAEIKDFLDNRKSYGEFTGNIFKRRVD